MQYEHGQATLAGPIDARCEALFASALQPSDKPTVTMAAAAISSAIRRFGTRGCACQMAQEFGDHPDYRGPTRNHARGVRR